jgi:hypothetical protein
MICTLAAATAFALKIRDYSTTIVFYAIIYVEVSANGTLTSETF